MSGLSPACGYEGEHYHAPGVDPNCLSCTHPPELDKPYFTIDSQTISSDGGQVYRRYRDGREEYLPQWRLRHWIWHCLVRRHDIRIDVVGDWAFFDCSCGDVWELRIYIEGQRLPQ